MPIAILSDIHGNLPALEAVVADAGARGCDAFFNLGDILSGPLWPAETADYLMSRPSWLTIRGNHERQLLESDPAQMGPSDAFAFARLSDRQLDWLRGLSATAEPSPNIFLCHGTPASDLIYFMEHVDETGCAPAPPSLVEERAGDRAEPLILCGHTHVARIVRLEDGRTVANPGSIGLQAYEDDKPFPHCVENGSPDARYAILSPDGLEIELIEAPYDHEAAARQAERNGRPDWARALLHGRMS